MPSELWVALIAAIISSGSLTALTTYVLTSRRDKKKTLSKNMELFQAFCDAVRFLMLRSLQEQCRLIIAKGCRTLPETEQLMKQYESHKAIGGDGWADDLYKLALEQALKD